MRPEVSMQASWIQEYENDATFLYLLKPIISSKHIPFLSHQV